MGKSKCRFSLAKGGCLLACYWAKWLLSIWLAVHIEYHVNTWIRYLSVFLYGGGSL